MSTPKDKHFKVKKNLEIDGVKYDVLYNPSSGSVQVVEKVKNVSGKQEVVWDSLSDSKQAAIINAIKDDTETVNNIEKKRTQNNGEGTQPGFLTKKDVAIANDPIAKRLRDKFITTEKDTYFGDLGSGNSAQYPIDALYGKRYDNSQDHLVISQYRYKAPRADAIFGKKSKPGEILTKGIARNAALDQFLGLVKMPMPNAIQDSNNVAWGEDTVNALEAAALAASDPSGGDVFAGVAGGVAGFFSDGVMDGIATGVAGNVGRQIIEKADWDSSILRPELQARILATLNIETSAESILARKEGVVPNSNLELLFSGPTLRQFSFVYKMSPRSSDEAKIVNRILRFFKQGMAARKQNGNGGGSTIGGASYFLGTPNVFRLQYRTTEDEAIKGLNRIKTCALTGTSVNYTPEGAFASYDRGQPVSILLTLAFQELEPIYDTDYTFEGGDGVRESDSGTGHKWKIDAEEVGY